VSEFKACQWWRVVDADGTVWYETADESAARKALAVVPRGELQRLFKRTEREWRSEGKG
jgi:alkylated DNA nucleotide flippase Atl1